MPRDKQRERKQRKKERPGVRGVARLFRSGQNTCFPRTKQVFGPKDSALRISPTFAGRERPADRINLETGPRGGPAAGNPLCKNPSIHRRCAPPFESVERSRFSMESIALGKGALRGSTRKNNTVERNSPSTDSNPFSTLFPKIVRPRSAFLTDGHLPISLLSVRRPTIERILPLCIVRRARRSPDATRDNASLRIDCATMTNAIVRRDFRILADNNTVGTLGIGWKHRKQRLSVKRCTYASLRQLLSSRTEI